MKRLVPILALVLATGCANLTGVHILPNTNDPGDRGPKPSLERVDQQLRAWLATNLKDPDSLRDYAVVQQPVAASCAVGIYGSFHGWRAMFQYNAKNSLGGYVGTQRWWAWFIGNDLVSVIGGDAGFCPGIRPSKTKMVSSSH